MCFFIAPWWLRGREHWGGSNDVIPDMQFEVFVFALLQDGFGAKPHDLRFRRIDCRRLNEHHPWMASIHCPWNSASSSNCVPQCTVKILITLLKIFENFSRWHLTLHLVPDCILQPADSINGVFYVIDRCSLQQLRIISVQVMAEMEFVDQSYQLLRIDGEFLGSHNTSLSYIVVHSVDFKLLNIMVVRPYDCVLSSARNWTRSRPDR